MLRTKSYRVGREAVDDLISALAAECGFAATEPLLREMLTTIIKLGDECSDRGDLKLVNNTLKELRYSIKVFSPYRSFKKVIIFGSARSKNSSAEYRMAEAFSKKATEKGYMVVISLFFENIKIWNKSCIWIR